MEIRPLTSEHEVSLVELHAKMGAPYVFDSKGPYALGSGIFNGAASPVVAMLGRPTLEVFAILNSAWQTPQDRLYAGERLYEHFEREAVNAGYVLLCASIPPRLERSFGKRLISHGWGKHHWPVYTKELIHVP